MALPKTGFFAYFYIHLVHGGVNVSMVMRAAPCTLNSRAAQRMNYQGIYARLY
jgi:hypothetical protein